MKTHLFGAGTAFAMLASSIMLPTFAFAQYYSYGTYQNQNCPSMYGSYYSYCTSSPYQMYGYDTGYQQPVIYISTGGDVYGGDYTPSFGSGTYGYQPSYGYGNYGYHTPMPNYYQNYYQQPLSYGYNSYPSYYGGNGMGYSNCSSSVGGVCGQDRSIGLGAALYNTVLPYNPYTGL